jgi:protein TonB
VAPPGFPPEVVELIANTETAIQNGDFKTAHTNIAALQQLAPTHPRLQSLKSLLEGQEMAGQLARSPSVSAGTSSRHGSSRKVGTTQVTAKRPDALFAKTPSADSLSSTVPDSPTITSPKQAPAVTVFGGRTIEEDSGLTAGAPSPATTAVARTASSASSMTEVRLVQSVAAEYPREAAQNGIEGTVDLSFGVSAAGEVHDVAVTHAVPSSIFNRVAIAAVRRWKYQPKTVNGIPVEAHVQVRLTFKLDRGN